MITKPLPFEDAVKVLLRKKLMPTSMKSEQLASVSASLRRNAMFSARVNNATFLQKASNLIARIVEPQAGGGGKASAVDVASARLELKKYLDSISYKPPRTNATGAAAELTDLSSDARLDLIIKTNTDMARGFGQFVQANDSDVLDAYPAQELVRIGYRKVPRDWQQRWVDAGGVTYGGRMIAKKSDSIWADISRFENPFPPFDFNSGMSVRPVSRREAERLGVIKKSESVKPSKATFGRVPNASKVPGLSQDIAAALQRAIEE